MSSVTESMWSKAWSHDGAHNAALLSLSMDSRITPYAIDATAEVTSMALVWPCHSAL